MRGSGCIAGTRRGQGASSPWRLHHNPPNGHLSHQGSSKMECYSGTDGGYRGVGEDGRGELVSSCSGLRSDMRDSHSYCCQLD